MSDSFSYAYRLNTEALTSDGLFPHTTQLPGDYRLGVVHLPSLTLMIWNSRQCW